MRASGVYCRENRRAISSGGIVVGLATRYSACGDDRQVDKFFALAIFVAPRSGQRPPDGADTHWNIWSASYAEARSIREHHGGYLLAYRRHFFIVDRYFIETLGLLPEDPDWE